MKISRIHHPPKRLPLLMGGMLLIILLPLALYLLRSARLVKADSYVDFNEGYGGTAHDLSGNISGTVTGATWVSEGCLDGKCLSFDGTGDYVTFGDPASGALDFAASDTFTLSVWFRHGPISSGTQVLLSKANGTGGGYKVYLNSDGTISFAIDDDAAWAAKDTATTTSRFDDNRWHMVTVTKTGTSKIEIFIDTVLLGSDVSLAASGSLANADTFYLGIDGNGSSNGWVGFMDDFKVYRSGRTQDQLKTDFMKGSPLGGSSVSIGDTGGGSSSALSDGLIGWWKLDESSGNTIDSSGNGLTLTNGGTTTFVAGKFGNGSEHIPGSSQYFSSGTTINGVRSVSFWVNPDSTTNYYLSLTADAFITSAGTISTTGLTNPQVYINGTLGTTITQDIWQLITVTFDTPINADQFYLGRQSSNYFDGTLDDVRLYNRALSPDEVIALYNWAPGPIGWWTMNEGSGTVVNDSSGNNLTGTRHNGGWGAGKYGPGFTTKTGNSIQDYVSVATNSLINFTNIQNYTLESWIKIGAKSDDAVILFNKGGTWLGQKGYGMTLFSNSGSKSTSCNYVDGDGSGSDQATASNVYNDNLWHHIVCVMDRTGSTVGAPGLYIFVDGVKRGADNTLTESDGGTGNNAQLTMGENNSTLYNFNGILDDVKIYNYARSPKQIIEDMNGGHAAPGSPVGSSIIKWDLDENNGGTAHNSGSGGSAYDATLSNTTWVTAGKIGSGLRFPVAAGYANAGDVAFIDGISGFTASLWLNPQSLATSKAILSKSNFSNNNSFGIITDPSTSSEIRVYLASGTSDSSNYLTTSGLGLVNGTWAHLSVVYDASASSKLKVYKNGNLVTGTVTGNIPNNMTSGTTSNFKLGASDSGSYTALNAIYDDVKFSLSAFTQNQIAQTMNQGGNAVMGFLSTSGDGKTASASAARADCIPGDTSPCNPPLANWNFNEGSGPTINDISGHGYNGNLYSNPSWVAGKNGQGLRFNGNNYGQIVGLLSSPATLTLAAWVNLTTKDTNGAEVISLGDHVVLRLDSTNGLTGFYAYDDSNWRTTVNNVNYAGTGWHYVAYVVDPSNSSETLYIDGTLTGSSTYNNSIHYADMGTDTFIGKHGNSNTNFDFNGIIDDVRVYNYARTPAQIAWDYNRGAPIAQYDFDECSGTAIHDAARKADDLATRFDGTLNIGATLPQDAPGTCTDIAATSHAWFNGKTGKYGASLSVDGVDDYVQIADNARLRPGNGSWSVTMWANPPNSSQGITLISKSSQSNPDYNEWALDICGSEDCAGNGKQLYATFIENLFTNTYRKTLSTIDVVDGNWHQYIMVADKTADKIKLYMDGRELNTTPYNSGSWPNVNNTATIRIGNDNSDFYYNGKIDDVRLYNYALTGEQIKTLYNQNSAVRFGP